MRSLVEWIDALLQRRAENWQLFPDMDPHALDAIHERCFALRDRRRFQRIWCEIAMLVDRTPPQLHEDDVIMDLSVDSNDTSFQGIVDLMCEHAKKRGQPEGALLTLGALVDWLLDDSAKADKPDISCQEQKPK